MELRASRHQLVALAATAFLLSGCNPNVRCTSSVQCPAGQVCVQVTQPGEAGSACQVLCSARTDRASPECADAGVGGYCYCPDSPAGSRCAVVEAREQVPTFFCSGTP